MTWRYSQSSGKLFDASGEEIGVGYSGNGPGKNNGAYEDIAEVGPIPRGEWKIVRWDEHHADKGPVVAVLEPIGHDAHGRSDFLIHGDSVEHPGNASHGCIIQNKLVREAYRKSGDTDLLVTE